MPDKLGLEQANRQPYALRSKDTERNSRLFPSRFDRSFCVLSRLRGQLESIVHLYLRHSLSPIIVDFGSGDAPYRQLFTDYLGSYVSVDTPTNALADFHFTPDGRSPLPSECADVVLSTQVLEHVHDPALYLAECHRMLKPEGCLILSTHGFWMYHGHPDDFWRWTGTGLRHQLEHSGFAVLELRGILGLAATALQLLQDALITRLPLSLERVFAGVFQLTIELVDRVSARSHPINDACVFIAVAAKQTSKPNPGCAS